MKKSLRKIIPAIAMLMISAALVGTSTFAWFSMNSKVTVTGMSVTTQVKDDLLIAPCETGTTAIVADNLFKTSLVQTVSGILEPVSTVDGVDFFWNNTKNTEKSGDALTNAYTAYDRTTNDGKNAFDANYGFAGDDNDEDCVGYVDYAFMIKATNTQGSAQDVKMTALNLVYGANDTLPQVAFRAAVFVNDMGADGATAATAPSTTSLKSILRVSGAEYFGKAKDNADEAVSATDDVTAVNAKIDDAVTIGNVGARATRYYKVVVRLWLEGEDTTCNNATFATLTDAWALDLTIELGGANAAVTNINQSVTASKVTLTIGTDNGVDAVPANVITIDGVAYYPISGKTLNTKQLYVSANKTLAAASRIFTIDSNLYPIEVTNQMNIVTPEP